MKGLFCQTNAKTNEEYRQVVKMRMRAMVVLGVIGIITLTVGLLAEFKWDININDHMLGVYTGVGAGLTAAAIVIWIKNKLVLSNEEKLKQCRLSDADERNQEISRRSLNVAAYVLLISVYLVGLVGGLYYPVLSKILAVIVVVFVISYAVSYKIYERKF